MSVLSKPASVPQRSSIQLSSEEINLIRKILEPLRYAKNTLTIGTPNHWDNDNRGPVSLVDAALHVLHTYRHEVTKGKPASDDLLIHTEMLSLTVNGFLVTEGHKGILQKLVKNANAEKLLIIEARLITEINHIIQSFAKHLEDLPCEFTDFPGGFVPEKLIEQYKKGIFNPVRWDEDTLQHSDILKLSTVDGAYTFLRKGNSRPKLIGRVSFMRVESVLLSGVTRVMNDTIAGRTVYYEEVVPVDVTATVVRIKDCFRPPHEVVPRKEMEAIRSGQRHWSETRRAYSSRRAEAERHRLEAERLQQSGSRGVSATDPAWARIRVPVLVPDKYMSIGIQVQWHMFASGVAFGTTKNTAWQANLLRTITLPTFSDVLSLISCEHLSFEPRKFIPTQFLMAML